MIYYKAIRPDGSSFHDPTFRWLPDDGIIPAGGWLVEHPHPAARVGRDSGADASEHLSVATVATDCTGMSWPCRLLAVEPVGRARKDDQYPHKRRVRAARVVAELSATDVLGPQGVHVAAWIERVGSLTADELDRWDAAWDAARDAAWDAARDAARSAAGFAAEFAALALLVRDLISGEHYDALTRPWRVAIGPCHPDDGPIA